MSAKLAWCVLGAFLLLPLLAVAGPDPKATYEGTCQKCHGPDGKGDTTAGRAAKVVSLVDPKFAVGPAEFMQLIKDNKKHRVPLKKLTDEDLAAAAQYARTLVGP